MTKLRHKNEICVKNTDGLLLYRSNVPALQYHSGLTHEIFLDKHVKT